MKKVEWAMIVILAILSAVIIIIGFTDVYGDSGDMIAEQVTDGNSECDYKFVTHANGKTYVVYTGSGWTQQEFYYLGEIKGNKIHEIGEIDELIGGNNEPSTFKLGDWTVNEFDYYKVMGMVQMDGKVYVAKKRHLYRLDGNSLTEVPLTFNGKPFVLDKFNAIINGLAANKDTLFLSLSVKGVFIVADPEADISTPLDSQMIRVSPDGDVELTYRFIPTFSMADYQSWSYRGGKFSISDDGSMVAFAGEISPATIAVYVEGRDFADKLVQKDGMPILNKRTEFQNVIFVGNDMYSYKAEKKFNGKSSNSFDGSVSIEKIQLKDYAKLRQSTYDVYGGAYLCTTSSKGTIKGPNVISEWTLGDDGYLYIIGSKTDELNDSAIQYDAIYRVKP